MFIQIESGDYINVTSCVSRVQVSQVGYEGRGEAVVTLTLWNGTARILTGEVARNFLDQFQKLDTKFLL